MRWRIRSLACKTKKHTSVVTTVAPETSGVPHAMVGTAYSAIIPGVRCWVHHRYADLRMSTFTLGRVGLRPAVHGASRCAGITRLGPSARDAVVMHDETTKAPRPSGELRLTHSAAHRTPRAATASRPASHDDREPSLNVRRDR